MIKDTNFQPPYVTAENLGDAIKSLEEDSIKLFQLHCYYY